MPHAGQAHVASSHPCNPAAVPSANEGVSSIVQNQPASSQPQVQGQPGRLSSFCSDRWWAPPATPHQQACADVLQQCLQQYRGGEPHMPINPYAYQTDISYHP